MTDQEKEICKKITEVWNAFLELPDFYHNEREIFAVNIDTLHMSIMVRSTARDNMDLFRPPIKM